MRLPTLAVGEVVRVGVVRGEVVRVGVVRGEVVRVGAGLVCGVVRGGAVRVELPQMRGAGLVEVRGAGLVCGGVCRVARGALRESPRPLLWRLGTITGVGL